MKSRGDMVNNKNELTDLVENTLKQMVHTQQKLTI